MLRKIWDWLDDRAGVRDAMRHALDERLPQRVGWAHVLGSGAMFLFIVQAVTGVLLAMNYSPSPDHAYWSILYIMNDVTMGKVIRGLHHWGASLMFIVVVLHMLRVFVYAAYKPPRELTWMVGVFLLMVVVGFSFTGYLLPWDQKAYWATQVGTEIPGTTPVVGPYLKQVMRGGDELGARTLSRFFAVHVLVLPALILLLIPLHLYLMRRKGETPPFTDESYEQVEKPVTFYPFQLFKDTVFAGVLLAILFLLTLVVGVHLEGMADPTPGSYVPRPEWYFLPIFQMLKFKIFEGKNEWLGAVLLPNVALIVLLLLPFLDRNPSRLPRKRIFAISSAFVVLLTAIVLGGIAYVQTPEQPPQMMLNQEAYLGKRLFQEKGCIGCHPLMKNQVGLGPSFAYGPPGKSGRSKEWLIEFLKNPKSVYPNTLMPPCNAPPDELSALAEFTTFFRMKWHRAKPVERGGS